MNASAKKLRLCVALLILNVAVIWGSSLLPGSVSGAVSGWLHQLLARLFGYSPEAQAGHGLLRKLAHVTEFACLGACFAWLLSLLGKQPAFGILCGFPVACLDECIQCVIPDRGPSVVDVGIDTLGLTLGTLTFLAGLAIYHKKNKKTNNMEEQK